MKSIYNEREAVPAAVVCEEAEQSEENSPLMDCQSMTEYERLHKPAELARAVLTMENESVLIRRPFRWSKNGTPLTDAHANMKLEQVCELYDWKIVVNFGHHFAIVAPQDKVLKPS